MNQVEAAEKYINGDWKDFHFKMMEELDQEKVLDIMEFEFWKDEPSIEALGYSQAFATEYRPVFQRFFKDGLSFMVIHKNTGEIAAVRMIFLHLKDMDLTEGLVFETRHAKVVDKLVGEIIGKADIFNRFSIDKFPDLFGAWTNPKYRNLGIQTEAYKRVLPFLQAQGYSFTKSIFTSPYTRSAARKMGFIELSRVNFSDVVLDDGSKGFPPESLNQESYAALLGIQF